MFPTVQAHEFCRRRRNFLAIVCLQKTYTMQSASNPATPSAAVLRHPCVTDARKVLGKYLTAHTRRHSIESETTEDARLARSSAVVIRYSLEDA